MGGEMKREPRVSVVTPFYNTAEYLGECIESVLRQSYRNFEYLLVDNKSTDGSRRVAESHAARDSRIRLVENDEFVDMLSNYNGALERIDPGSRYVKIAQADDVLFPECLSRMVELAEAAPGVGIVSSYYLMGESLCGEGIPRGVSVIRGRDACRRILLDRLYVTGSQTTVLYRADLVRSRRPFFARGHDNADTEIAMDILLEHDLGFVHQVLSFSRVHADSASGALRDRYKWMKPYFLVLLERYGRAVLTDEEWADLNGRLSREYFRFLGAEALRFPGRSFWEYQRHRLAQVGRPLSWIDVGPWALVELLRSVLSPGRVVERLAKGILARRRRTRSESPPWTEGVRADAPAGAAPSIDRGDSPRYGI
jgi:glycosyltransferase involved in cell wall biosynthesis